MKALVVAAVPARAASLASRLAARGHSVAQSSIDDARLDERFDLLLFDAPCDQAEALCRALLSSARGRTPFTLFVGEPSAADLERLLHAGVDGFITTDDSFELRLTVAENAARARGLVADLTSELRESEERYRSVIAAMQEAVLVINREGRVLTCNASSERILERTREEIVARSARDERREFVRADGTIFPEGEHPAAVTLRTGVSVSNVVLGLRRTNGDTTWLSVSSQPLGMRHDGLPDAVVVSLTDLTDIRRSEANFRGLIERSPDGILVHRDGQVLFANAKWVSMLGFDRAEECAARSVIDFVHSEDQTTVLERIQRIKETGTEAPPLVLRLMRRDGDVVHAEVLGIAIHFDGAPAMLTHARDMTDRRRLEAELGTADRLASVGRLAAAVGHEINNPLAYVVGNLDLLDALLKGDVDTESATEARRLLADARDGADRVRRIVRDLKLFSQRDADERGAVDVKRVLESSIGIAWNEIRHRARLVKEFGDTPPVHANEARLGQVFLNLLVNAAQAIPEGNAERHEVRVTTRTEALANVVIVEVRDTGVGMPPEVLRRVFEPFFTTKPAGAGTGLGLSICQTLVHASGGEIGVESEVGKGTTVRVTLPISADAVASSNPQPSSPRTSEPRYRILIVDDEPRVAITLRHLLSEHDVVTVASGREAIDALGKADVYFDAILCDLMMSDLTGMDVFEVLKLARPGMQKRMIFMTGGAFTPRASTFVATIENPCLEKPFPVDDLLRAIRRVVRETALSERM